MNGLRYAFGALLLGILGIVLVTRGCSSRSAIPTRVPHLTTLFEKLDPWQAKPTYSAEAWEATFRTCDAMSHLTPPVIEEEIRSFLGRSSLSEKFYNQTKIFILLRVYFDLPEHAPLSERVASLSWRGSWDATNSDGTISLAWPVAWKSKQPYLSQGFEGYEGRDYDPVAEFRYLNARFKRRSLDE